MRYPDGDYAWRLRAFDVRTGHHAFLCDIFSLFEERDAHYELGSAGWTGNVPLGEDTITIS